MVYLSRFFTFNLYFGKNEKPSQFFHNSDSQTFSDYCSKQLQILLEVAQQEIQTYWRLQRLFSTNPSDAALKQNSGIFPP